MLVVGADFGLLPSAGFEPDWVGHQAAGPLPLIFVDDTMNQIVYRAVQHGSHVATRIH